MSREDQRLMLVGSALTGLMSQQTLNYTEFGNQYSEPTHYTDDELADAAMKAVKVADLALTALGARIPDKLDVYECLQECWAFLAGMASRECPDSRDKLQMQAAKLLVLQRGTGAPQ